MRQILCNLISNALKFTEAGVVTVKVAHRQGWIKLSVSDTGIGIAREDLRRLFEKFEQGDASTTRRYGGSGLGLAICRQLAELMGGHITVRSRVGKGTTFVTSLRLERLGASRAVAAPAALETVEFETASARILAAEDNEINQLVLKTLLHQIGVEPMVVENGQEALDAWRGGE